MTTVLVQIETILISRPHVIRPFRLSRTYRISLSHRTNSYHVAHSPGQGRNTEYQHPIEI